MSESSVEDSGLSESASQRHRRAIGLIAVAALVLGSASVAYLSSTGVLHLGAFPAAASQARTQSPADSGPKTGPPIFLPSPTVVTPLPRTAGLVVPGAIGVLIEQFGGLNDQPPLGLKASVRINDPAVISRLTRELNALPPFPDGVFSCPMDDGSYFVVVFTYGRGTSTTVKLEAHGCGGVFVGDSTQPVAWTLTSPGLLNSLTGLVGQPGG